MLSTLYGFFLMRVPTEMRCQIPTLHSPQLDALRLIVCPRNRLKQRPGKTRGTRARGLRAVRGPATRGGGRYCAGQEGAGQEGTGLRG